MKKGEPFDPEELSRRLKAHLSQQKIEAERRRLARAAAQQKALYHHVPSGAAAAFEKTTTSEGLRQVHRLSQPALKQLDGLCLDDSVPGRPLKTILQRTQALDQAAAERDTLRNRNQFQWTHGMEEAAGVDNERGIYKPPTRSFDAYVFLLKLMRKLGALGDGFLPSKTFPPGTKLMSFVTRETSLCYLH